MHLNRAGATIAEAMIAEAASLGATLHDVSGVRVLDCGTKTPGSTAAGVGMAHAALAGLGSVALEPATGFADEWPDCRWPVVSVASGEPVAACLAAQYAGWKVATQGYFAMASGPLRAAIGREPLYDDIGLRERTDVAVGLLETATLPPADVCLGLAKAAGVQPEGLILLVARTASIAGTLQVIARSLETALHKLHDLHFDLRRIRRGHGRAPLAPVPLPADDLTAIGRTNDAILYGGHVVLEVGGDDESLLDVGPRAVSRASAAYGDPFAMLFERAGRDFYALDPALFAPALLDFVNIDTGRTHRFGGLAAGIVARSFGTTTGA